MKVSSEIESLVTVLVPPQIAGGFDPRRGVREGVFQVPVRAVGRNELRNALEWTRRRGLRLTLLPGGLDDRLQNGVKRLWSLRNGLNPVPLAGFAIGAGCWWDYALKLLDRTMAF